MKYTGPEDETAHAVVHTQHDNMITVQGARERAVRGGAAVEDLHLTEHQMPPLPNTCGEGGVIMGAGADVLWDCVTLCGNQTSGGVALDPLY